MADVNTIMKAGMSWRKAKAVVDHATLGVDGLVALGFHPEMAKLIMATGTTTVGQLMALGMPAMLAVEVEAVINP